MEFLNLYTMKSKLLTSIVLTATVFSVTSCSKTEDLLDCAYGADEAACERLEQIESSTGYTMYQEPDSVKVNLKKLPTLD